MPKHKFLLILLCSALSMRSTSVQAQQEYAIKATFLFNFTKFVTWPATSLEEGAPFIIGIAGTDPFGNSLISLVRDEKMQGHPIIVRQFATTEALTACHILFINISEKNEIRKLLEKVKGWNVLTVGDQAIIEKQGGMIRFVTDQNKTKLRINATAAKDAKLVISSKLLNLAEIVNE